MLIKNILLTQGDCAIDNSHLPKTNYTQFYKEDAYEQSRKHTRVEIPLFRMIILQISLFSLNCRKYFVNTKKNPYSLGMVAFLCALFF